MSLDNSSTVAVVAVGLISLLSLAIAIEATRIIMDSIKGAYLIFLKRSLPRFFIMLYEFLLIYLVCINIIAIIITVVDKIAAIKGYWRISEKALLSVSALGGSFAMLSTMLVIRHKTRKPKFMLLIPLMIVIQIALIVFVMVKL